MFNPTVPAYLVNIEFILWIVSANILLHSKQRRILSLLSGLLFYVPLLICASIPFPKTILFFIQSFVFCIYVQILFDKGIPEKSFYISIILFPSVITLFISSLITSILSSGKMMIHIIILLMIHLPVMFITNRWKDQYNSYLSENDFYILSFFSFSVQIFLILFSSYLAEEYTYSLYYAPIILTGAASYITLLYILNRITYYARWHIRVQKYDNAIHADSTQNQYQKTLYESTAKMRHDIDNHMLAIQSLLEHNRYHDAANYAEELSRKDFMNNHLPDCHNSVVAIYLETKFNEILQNGIKLNSDIQIPRSLKVSNPDLISVFGNILDNAVEACAACSDPQIDIKAIFQPPYLTISCLNSKPTDFQKNRLNEFPRGKGFIILSDIAEEYDGWFSSEEKGFQFYTEIVLKNGG